VDFSKLKTSDWLIGGGTIVFLIAMFLPWYKAEVKGFEGIGGGSTSHNGWSYFLQGTLPLILLLAVAVVLYLKKFQPNVSLPDAAGPVSWSQAYLIACGVAAFLVLTRLLITDKFGTGGFVDSAVDFSRGLGLFLAFLAALAATAGAYLKFQGKEDDAGAAPSGPPTSF